MSRVSVASGVGVFSGVLVKVGRGDSVGAAVLEGIAAWVCATMVKSTEIAVFCKSSPEISGEADAIPQALSRIASVIRMLYILTFIYG